MTIPEIIETLKVAKAEVEWNYPLDYAIVIDETIEHLEKQIPKKAKEETINRGMDISGEYDIECNLCCPICGAVVGTFETGENEFSYKYCPECGQALDWS